MLFLFLDKALDLSNSAAIFYMIPQPNGLYKVIKFQITLWTMFSGRINCWLNEQSCYIFLSIQHSLKILHCRCFLEDCMGWISSINMWPTDRQQSKCQTRDYGNTLFGDSLE